MWKSDSRMDPAQALEASMLAQQQPMLAAMAQGESDVQRFYKNSVVFITGGSGFLGKQLLEKLFRSCEISKVYMLIRSKKEKNINERIKEITKDPVFDTLQQQQPTFSNKIFAIEGDVAEVKLGIKEKDWETLTQEVDVIFHVAATTRFDESLRTATLINVRGTREALHLGKNCKKLRSYVHVSTAYSHATYNLIGGEVQEEFYNTPVPPDTMISLVETMELERLNNITNDLTKDWPNTYTFTKAIAEEQVRTASVDLPVCIVRPAIVLSTYREPSPGWLDMSCLYGIAGVVVGAGLGVVHAALLDRNVTAGLIPCDYVNNAIIVAARETANNQAKGGNHTKIYTVCSTNRNPVKYRTLTGTLENEAFKLIPSPKAVYYPFSIYTTRKHWLIFLSLFMYVIPAYVADVICVSMGKERRFVKLVKKFYKLFNTLQYFTTNEWNFIDNNVDKLYRSQTKQDQAIFNFDVMNIDWTNMILAICIGLRKYIIKDGLKGTEYAVKKMKYLKIGHYIFTIFYAYCVWKVLYLMFFLGNTLISTCVY